MAKPMVTPLRAVDGVFIARPNHLVREFYCSTPNGLVWLCRHQRKNAYTKQVIGSVRRRAAQVRQLAEGGIQ